MNVPGLPFPVSVPVAHNDRPPEGDEAAVFTYKPATDYDEMWVGIDLVTARRLGNKLVRAMADLPLMAWTP
jgi:hypothetical protein